MILLFVFFSNVLFYSFLKKFYLCFYNLKKEKNMPTVLVLFGMRFYYWAREHEPIQMNNERN